MKEFRHFEVFDNDHFMPGYRKWLDELYIKTKDYYQIPSESWLDTIIQLDEMGDSLLHIVKSHSNPTYFRPFYYMLLLDAHQYSTSSNDLKPLIDKHVLFDNLMDCFNLHWCGNGGYALTMGIHGDHLKSHAFLPARKAIATAFYKDFNPTSNITEYHELDDYISEESNLLSILPSIYILSELGEKESFGDKLPEYFKKFARLNLLDMPANEQVESITQLIKDGWKGDNPRKVDISRSLTGLADAILERSMIRLLNGQDAQEVYDKLIHSCDSISVVSELSEHHADRFKTSMTRALFINFPEHFKKWCPGLSFDDVWHFNSPQMKIKWNSEIDDYDNYGMPINPATYVRGSVTTYSSTVDNRYVFLRLIKESGVPITKEDINTVISPTFAKCHSIVRQMVDDNDDLIPMVKEVLIDLIKSTPNPTGSLKRNYEGYLASLYYINGKDVQETLMEGLAKCLDSNNKIIEEIKIDLTDPDVKQLIMEKIALDDHDHHRQYLSITGLTHHDFKKSGIKLPNRFLASLLEHHISL